MLFSFSCSLCNSSLLHFPKLVTLFCKLSIIEGSEALLVALFPMALTVPIPPKPPTRPEAVGLEMALRRLLDPGVEEGKEEEKIDPRLDPTGF